MRIHGRFGLNGVRLRARRSLGVRRGAMAATAVGYAAVAVVAIHAPVARADALSQTFTTPGTYLVGSPLYANLVHITVQGASGMAGGASSPFGTNPGGAGGLGTVVTASAIVGSGEAITVIVGEPAAASRAPRGTGTAAEAVTAAGTPRCSTTPAGRSGTSKPHSST